MQTLAFIHFFCQTAQILITLTFCLIFGGSIFAALFCAVASRSDRRADEAFRRWLIFQGVVR